MQEQVKSYLQAGDVVVFKKDKKLSPIQYVVMAVWLPCDFTENEDPSEFSAAIELQSLLTEDDKGYDYIECGEFDLKKVGKMKEDSEDFQNRYQMYLIDNHKIYA